MDLKANHALSFLIAIKFIIILSTCWYLLCFFKSNQKTCVIINQFTSYEAENKIKSLVDQLHKLNAFKISQELKNIFPNINLVEKIYKSNGRKIIKIKTETPLYQINNNQVLTSGTLIIENNFYNAQDYENLYKIYISDKLISPIETKQILKFLENINNNQILENYIITWHDKTVITFLDKVDNFFYIKTEYKTGFPVNLLKNINKLKEKIKIEKQKSRKKYDVWCADIRFGDKIVLTLKGEGEHEGQKFIK